MLAARGEQPAASLTLLTTMLDFTEPASSGLSSTRRAWPRARRRSARAALLKGSELAQVFASLRANDLIWPYVVNNYLKGKAPPAFDLLYWNSDATNLPGPMFCWYLRNMYLENKLREPGGTAAAAASRSTSARIDVPAFVYASQGRPHRAVEVGLREHAAARRATSRSCSAPAATSPA